jgi:hypothetical protein
MIHSDALSITGNGKKHISEVSSEPVVAPSNIVGFQEKE